MSVEVVLWAAFPQKCHARSPGDRKRRSAWGTKAGMRLWVKCGWDGRAQTVRWFALYCTSRADVYADASDLHEAAQRLLRYVNGVARVLDPSYRPVALAGRYEDGSGHNTQLVVVDTVETRCQVGAVTVLVDGDDAVRSATQPRSSISS